jgi:ectoine hydroxylase
VHSSPPNMSPWDRRIFSLILNPVRNRQTAFGRPDHQHHRDFTPVHALEASFLAELSSADRADAGRVDRGR